VSYETEPQNRYQSEMRAKSSTVTNHIAMRHTARLVERFRAIKPGQSLKDVAREHGQKRNLSGEINEKPFKYNNYRLPWDEPSLAIPASFQSLFIHPSQDRNLTAREASRLMSFPDTFLFMGKRTTMSWEKSLSQYNQIGNAVCPAVGAALARSVKTCLQQAGATAASRLHAPQLHKARARAEQALSLPSPLGREALVAFDKAGSRISELLGLAVADGKITLNSNSLPVAVLPVALLLSTESSCQLCRIDLEPNGIHSGSIPFLISKDGIETLVGNENDHGLDFHLRAMFGISSECGHFVGDALGKAGMAILEDVINPRTGRKVRGMTVSKCPPWVESLRSILRDAIRDNETGTQRVRQVG
jgi:hypothetical protein